METLRERAAGVRAAQRTIGSAEAERRTAALRALKAVLVRSRAEISQANDEDLARAAEEGLSGSLLHRLGLPDAKFESLLEGIDALVDGEDPIDRVLTRTELDEGLVLERVRSPLGVLLIIFESRPDAVIQIGSLAIRSGNGVIMKGGREAARSNEVLVGCLRRALEEAGLDPRAVLGVPDRRDVDELLALDDLIDLVIPRGSGALVRSIQERSRIPVLGHAEGVCHLYVDASADPEMAAAARRGRQVRLPGRLQRDRDAARPRGLPAAAGPGRRGAPRARRRTPLRRTLAPRAAVGRGRVRGGLGARVRRPHAGGADRGGPGGGRRLHSRAREQPHGRDRGRGSRLSRNGS